MAAMKAAIPERPRRGPTAACSYPLLKELCQPAYQEKSMRTQPGRVRTQVLKIIWEPNFTFSQREWKRDLKMARIFEKPLTRGAESQARFCWSNQLGQCWW